MNETANKEHILNPLFIMRCLEYYYEKTYNDKTHTYDFSLYFVYPLAKGDLFSLIKDLRTSKFNYPEEKVIPMIW
jgi:hypothetical protein